MKIYFFLFLGSIFFISASNMSWILIRNAIALVEAFFFFSIQKY